MGAGIHPGNHLLGHKSDPFGAYGSPLALTSLPLSLGMPRPAPAGCGSGAAGLHTPTCNPRVEANRYHPLKRVLTIGLSPCRSGGGDSPAGMYVQHCGGTRLRLLAKGVQGRAVDAPLQLAVEER